MKFDYEFYNKEYGMTFYQDGNKLPYWERLSTWGKIWRIGVSTALLLFILLVGLAIKQDPAEGVKMLFGIVIAILVVGFLTMMGAMLAEL